MAGASFQSIITRVMSWQTLLTPTLNADSATWDGYCIVNALAAVTSTGGAYRLTLTPPSAGVNLVIASCWIGMANTAPNFDGNQVQVKFSGANGVTLTAGGATVVSDPVSPTTPFTTAGTILVSFGITSGDKRRNIGISGYSEYSKAADAANAGGTTKSGYTLGTTTVSIISKLEAFN